MDAHKNFSYSTVATAPSPATSGTSLVVASGDGSKFPATPFNATVWPTGSNALTSNAEIVRVTAISTDTLTITRAQESTSARTVVVGDQIAATVTAKTLSDIENRIGVPTVNRRTVSDVSVTSTSFTAVDTALDITLSAVAGDRIQFGISFRAPSSTSLYLEFDVASINGSGTILNRWLGGQVDGINAFLCSIGSSGQEDIRSGTEWFDVVSGDIVSSTVKLRVYTRIHTSGSRTIYSNSVSPFTFWAVNRGQ